MAKVTTPTGSGSFTIPTKRHNGDSGTQSSHKQPLALSDGASQTEPKDEDQDAFSRYSNDVLRMNALLNFSEDESADDLDLDAIAKINDTLRGVGLSGLTMNHTNAPKRRKGNSAVAMPIDQERSERKTRLSWELHPHLLMYDMMEELEALENSHYIASDQGEDIEAMLFGGEDGAPGVRQIQALFGVAAIEDED